MYVCTYVQVEALSNVTVTAVACGAFHSLAVTSSGRLYEWGLVHTEPDWSADEVYIYIYIREGKTEWHLLQQVREKKLLVYSTSRVQQMIRENKLLVYSTGTVQQ